MKLKKKSHNFLFLRTTSFWCIFNWKTLKKNSLHHNIKYTRSSLIKGWGMYPTNMEKIAFRTHHGHFEFVVMPFGLTNAPRIFQALMNEVFQSYVWKLILIFFMIFLSIVTPGQIIQRTCDLSSVSLLLINYFSRDPSVLLLNSKSPTSDILNQEKGL